MVQGRHVPLTIFTTQNMASSSPPAVIGLDLGTFNLRAAVFRDDRVELIKDELGNDSTPAFVGFNLQSESVDNLGCSTTVLGRHAYDLAQRNLSHPVYGLKKLLGRKPDDPVIISERGNWPFEIAAGQDGFAAVSIPAAKSSSSGKLYRPEELLSMVLRKVVENVDVHLGVPVKEAVATVPACFGFMDRVRITQLCDAAGIEVKRFVNEAWAAAVAHGFETESKDTMNVIVINVGAGFVDICCMTIDDTIYEVCSSYGYPLTPDTQKEFSSGNFHSLEKCIRSVQIQAQARIDQILLSGGSPILPEIQRAFCNLFVGVAPVIIAKPSTAAVRGIAIYAALLGGDRNKRFEDFIVLSATNFALGVKVIDGSVKTVLQQNLTCPARVTRQFTTSIDNQTAVVFEVYETGEQGGVCEDGAFLGEVVLSGLPPLPKGRLVLDVTINVETNHHIAVKVGYAQLNMEKSFTISKVMTAIACTQVL